jgi:erythronate-4-phosphate dehydrogenase
MKRGAWFINTSRGAVVEESALVDHAGGQATGPVVLDVWASEPRPNPALLALTRLGTPHVAGYSLDAKLAATYRIARDVRAFLGIPHSAVEPDVVARALEAPSDHLDEAAWHHAIIRQMYDIEAESDRFRSAMLASDDPDHTFARFRQEHMARRSFRRYTLPRSAVPDQFHGVADVLEIEVHEDG